MDSNLYWNAILDSFPDSIYVLDQDGNYIFANSSYINLAEVYKEDLLKSNVHDFVREKWINLCISDIVYKKKIRVALFQDIYNRDNITRLWRQLVISTPVFNDKGDIDNIVAVVRPVDFIHDYLTEAYRQSALSSDILNNPKEKSEIVAESLAMRQILKTADAVADIDSAVLITGETGTGKEVLAQYIHNSSNHSQKPMTVLNCASLPPSLLEAELFGYEKGAFTGALSTGKVGFFEEANGSTLFLDEINSIPLDTQGKLLRAIETKQIQRLGSTKLRQANFRLIAATNEDLYGMVESKRFRADLFYRLNVIPMEIPPLRDRREDIIPLAIYYLNHYCKKYGKASMFTQKSLDVVYRYSWPGNVRELKNFVERSVVMSLEGYITIDSIESIPTKTVGTTGLVKNEKSQIGMDIYDYSELLKNGVSLNEFLNQCGVAYVKYALDTYKSSYQAALALGTSQSSVMRRKRLL